MKPIIILLLSLLPFGAFAGEPAPASAAGEPTVAELSAQLEALKARTSTWDKIAARLPRISGYVQTGYEWSETSSTFFIKRVRLNLAGDIAEKLDYRVQIEFCGPKIVDAYIRYRPFEQLNFQLGEYKLPFSIENTDYVPPSTSSSNTSASAGGAADGLQRCVRTPPRAATWAPCSRRVLQT